VPGINTQTKTSNMCFGSKVDPLSNEATIIEVFAEERGYGSDWGAAFLMDQGTAIGSVYKVDGDHTSINQKLTTRMKEILAANPWLMSRFLHVKPNHLGLVIEPATSNPDDYILTGTSEGLVYDNDVTYEKLKTVLCDKRYRLKGSEEQIGKTDGELTKFSIIWHPEHHTMAIVMAVSHVLADGATIYALWKMLDMNQPVVALQAERFLDMETQKIKETQTSFLPVEFTEQTDFFHALETPQFAACMLKGIAQEIKGRKMRALAFVIDQDEVARRKEQFKGETFVSTNDVITSFMHDLVPGKIDNIMLPINLRGRLPGVTANMAGNYLGTSIMRTSDMVTPRAVRTWLENILKPGYQWSMPKFKDFRRYVGGIHTNWCSFYHHVQPEGTTQITHFPIVPKMDMWIGPIPIGSELDMITYKSNPDEVSCFVFTRRPGITRESLLANPLIKSELMKME